MPHGAGRGTGCRTVRVCCAAPRAGRAPDSCREWPRRDWSGQVGPRAGAPPRPVSLLSVLVIPRSGADFPLVGPLSATWLASFTVFRFTAVRIARQVGLCSPGATLTRRAGNSQVKDLGVGVIRGRTGLRPSVARSEPQCGVRGPGRSPGHCPRAVGGGTGDADAPRPRRLPDGTRAWAAPCTDAAPAVGRGPASDGPGWWAGQALRGALSVFLMRRLVERRKAQMTTTAARAVRGMPVTVSAMARPVVESAR